jgi:hypothetical protein
MKDRPSFDSPIRNVIPSSWEVHGVAEALYFVDSAEKPRAVTPPVAATVQ